MTAPEREQSKRTRSNRSAPDSSKVLVAILNNVRDWQIVNERLWYRVPIDKAPKSWLPKWVAFYHTKVFGDEAYAVRYYGRVRRIEQVSRRDLLPDESTHPNIDRKYYKVSIESLRVLERPIPSLRLRRIVFIPTTWHKLTNADEINDLFNDSPLEDLVWDELKKLQIWAERQHFVRIDGKSYALDFALFCNEGNIDVETDGDKWHSMPERVREDNRRNNDLASLGYQVLRFNTSQVREEMAEYCVPQIVNTVKRLGGLQPPKGVPSTYVVSDDGVNRQLHLFEEAVEYDPSGD